MVVVIVAYEYGIERWEMPGLAGGRREALGSHRNLLNLKDRVTQGTKAGRKLDKAACMA
jgi:hypothetical protein